MTLEFILHIIFLSLTCLACSILAFTITGLYFKHKCKESDAVYKKVTQAAVSKVHTYYRVKEKKNLALYSFIENLIVKANIRVSIVNPLSVLLISILIGIVSFSYLLSITYWLNALIIAMFFMTIPSVIIYFIAQSVAARTDKSIIDFANVMQNFLEIEDDITFAFENIANFNLKPLSQYCCDYVFDIRHGYTSIDALHRFQKKIDNAQLRRLIHTLINCSQNSGKYLLVVERFKNNYIELYDKLLTRKKEAYKARLSILIMIGIMCVVFTCLIITNYHLLELLSTTLVGNILSSFALVAIISAFFVALNVGHFDFD